jgi:hypothetical protein
VAFVRSFVTLRGSGGTDGRSRSGPISTTGKLDIAEMYKLPDVDLERHVCRQCATKTPQTVARPHPLTPSMPTTYVMSTSKRLSGAPRRFADTTYAAAVSASAARHSSAVAVLVASGTRCVSQILNSA